MDSLAIVQVIIGANSLAFALLLAVLRLRGRPVNIAVPLLFVALGLMALLNLAPADGGLQRAIRGVRWGLPLSFGPLLLLYVWRSAGRPAPDWRRLALHAVTALLLVLAFASGRVPARWASLIILASIGGYVLAVARLGPDLEGRARGRAAFLSRLGGIILACNLLLQAAEAWTPAAAPALNLVIFLLLLVLVGYFVAAGLTDPEALFLSVARPMGLAPSALPEVEAAAILARAEALFEAEAPYLDPDFQLARLAERLDLPPRQVSRAINQASGLSVPDYIGRARVRAVERRLADARETASILELALDCGFNSKATFNRALARHAGRTPREARRAGGGAAPLSPRS